MPAPTAPDDPERDTSLIHPVCCWKDGVFVVNSMDERSLCDKMSQREGLANFVAVGAGDRDSLGHVVAPEQRSRFGSGPPTV
jgi:Cysteine-rich CPCC